MSNMHFEELWEKCEQLHQQADDGHEVPMASLSEELLMKIKLYQAIDAKTDIPVEDRQKIKSRTLGEILLTLTHISLKDNINVFDSLNTALYYRNIGFYQQKY